MSKRISLKKLGQKVEESKGESSMGRSIPAKRMVIGEKCSREDSTNLPNKKGEAVDSSKRKEAAPMPETKKKVKTSNVASSRATLASKPGEGTLASLGTVLGPKASILNNPSGVEKILWGVIPPAGQGEGGIANSGSDGHKALPCYRPGTTLALILIFP